MPMRARTGPARGAGNCARSGHGPQDREGLGAGGFDWAVRNACLSHYERAVHTEQAAWKRELKRAPARVQWDPERDLRLQALPYRSLQLGLAGEAVRRYADEWIVGIRDVTPLAHRVHALVRDGQLDAARGLLPVERVYPGPAVGS
ncbi:DUF4291 family protein [Streptomyces sp. ASQP_92]|uniref:DUF4291 family protein n=1 Tax=Streptomyces sp. ASQP_92 TaxID=2979116 RepID=UPI0037D9B8B7